MYGRLLPEAGSIDAADQFRPFRRVPPHHHVHGHARMLTSRRPPRNGRPAPATSRHLPPCGRAWSAAMIEFRHGTSGSPGGPSVIETILPAEVASAEAFTDPPEGLLFPE